MNLRFVTMLSALLVSAAGISVAHADTMDIRQDLISPDGTSRVEVSSFIGETDGDRQRIADYIAQLYEKDLRENPNLARNFERVELPGAQGSGILKESAQAAEEDVVGKALTRIAADEKVTRKTVTPQSMAALVRTFEDLPAHRQKIVFSLARGFINGGITTWNLAVSQGLPLPVAAAAGLVTGAMSGSFQFWNGAIQTYLTKSLVKQWFPTSLVAARVAKVEPFFRWYALEIGFTGVIELVMGALGHPSDEDPEETMKKSAVTAGLAVFAQGFWDVALGEDTKHKLAQAATERLKKGVQMRADLYGLGISVLSVTAAVSRIVGLDMVSYCIFGAMALTGPVFFAKVQAKLRRCAAALHSPEERLVPAEEAGAIDLGETPPPIASGRKRASTRERPR